MIPYCNVRRGLAGPDTQRGRNIDAGALCGRTSRKAMASLIRETPLAPNTPVGTKNDCGRQVSWLAGQGRTGRLLGGETPMA